MAGNAAGGEKRAAAAAGLSLEDYRSRVAAGERRCVCCKTWQRVDALGLDASRPDGVARTCLACRSKRGKATYQPRPRTSKLGSQYAATRDGDKAQARHRTNHAMVTGLLPNPNDLPCTDCGHVAKPGERHEYDHYLGYSAEHQLDVQAVCTVCHHKRDNPNAKKGACKRGHAFTSENTVVDGDRIRRHCVTCRRDRDRKRTRPPGYWKAVNQRRRARMSNGI